MSDEHYDVLLVEARACAWTIRIAAYHETVEYGGEEYLPCPFQVDALPNELPCLTVDMARTFAIGDMGDEMEVILCVVDGRRRLTMEYAGPIVVARTMSLPGRAPFVVAQHLANGERLVEPCYHVDGEGHA